MTLNEAQIQHNLLSGRLEARFREAGLVYRLEDCLRSDEQAAINALKEEGRSTAATLLEFDPRFHYFAMALRNNGKGNGIVASVHLLRLARDYSLFRKRDDGEYVYLNSTEDHRPFGEWWEAQHALARWGGRFSDGNHYSFEWQGRR